MGADDGSTEILLAATIEAGRMKARGSTPKVALDQP